MGDIIPHHLESFDLIGQSFWKVGSIHSLFH